MTRSPDSSWRDHGERPQGHRCAWVGGQAPLAARAHPLGCFQALPSPSPRCGPGLPLLPSRSRIPLPSTPLPTYFPSPCPGGRVWVWWMEPHGHAAAWAWHPASASYLGDTESVGHGARSPRCPEPGSLQLGLTWERGEPRCSGCRPQPALGGSWPLQQAALRGCSQARREGGRPRGQRGAQRRGDGCGGDGPSGGSQGRARPRSLHPGRPKPLGLLPRGVRPQLCPYPQPGPPQPAPPRARRTRQRLGFTVV